MGPPLPLPEDAAADWPCHRRDKAIAAPGNRLDAATLGSPVIEDAAQCSDLDVEVAVFDHRSRPDGLDDLVSQDEIARPLNEYAEKVERPPPDGYRRVNTLPIALEQDTGVPVEPKTLEQRNIGRGECIHSCASRAARNFLKI